MPVKLISSGGGSIILDANTTASNYTVNIPAQGGALLTTGTTSGINASAMSVGTLPHDRFAAGGIIQSTTAQTNSTNGWTNSEGTFISHSITKKVSTSYILAICNFMWGGDNPNGHWRLERSYDNSSFTALGYISRDEPDNTGDLNSDGIHYLDSNSSSYTTIYYRLYWYHSARNGGTMYVNRSYNGDTQGGSSGMTTLSLFEVKV